MTEQAYRVDFDWTRRRVLVHYPTQAVSVLDVDSELWALVRTCCGADAVLLPGPRSSVARFSSLDGARVWLDELLAEANDLA